MKKCYLIGLLILTAFSLGLMSGCGSSEVKTLAKVGDYEIKTDEFQDFYKNFRFPYATAQDEFDKKKELLDSLIIKRLLIQAAYEIGIDQLEEISRVVLANKDRFVLDILYLRQILDKATVSEAEIKDYYNHLQYKIRASHILVKDLDTANSLSERIMNGENFDQLAYEFSIDPSAKRNRGDLGYFTWGSMVDGFQEAAFSMEPGEMSPPVETQFGYHIIKVVDKQPNELFSDYETMKPSIEGQLKMRKLNQLTMEFLDEVRKKVNIQIEKSTCDYLMHKRENLYPPQILANLPKNDFDLEQLDRSERELILATWNGGQMTLFEYLNAIKQYPHNARPNFDNYDSLATFVFIIKSSDMLTNEANAMGLENDPEYKRKIKLFKEYNMASVMRDDSLPKPAPPEELEIRKYYDEHPGEFTTQAKIHVYEILLSDELLARKLAREIKTLNKFKEKAAELTERAGKRGTNGDLGVIERDWFPEVFDLARKTAVGKIGGPVVTQGKYSIFYVADKQKEEMKNFLDVKGDIQARITYDRKNDIFLNWLEERRKNTKVVIYDDALWSTIDKDRYVQADTTGQMGG
ncbi:MAG: peptidylprolyl isomerase [candidate division Zixibacteria bacterium]|nr:peptidylprolyl isomerase [candidate division Zixibacteria bacterium]